MSSLADNLPEALDRIADFNAVQRGRGADELADAVNCLQESVGSTKTPARSFATASRRFPAPVPTQAPCSSASSSA
jgi:hypothetical protein